MIVMKFGGTSVESQEAIARVSSIVQSYQSRRPIVVVSAMGKTTNKLLQAAREAAAGRRDQALALVDELRAHHLMHGLPLAGAAAADLDRYIRAHFDWLDELVNGLSVVGELSARSMDAIASVGERLSSLVVTFAFQSAGMRTQHVDARRVILTDDRFTQAQPFLDETYALLQENVKPAAETSVVVMGGFIGATKDGQTTTLGRGGSDYSASLSWRRSGRRRNPDLDGCGWNADGRSSHRSRRPPRQKYFFRGSGRNGVLRRESAASGYRSPRR